MISYMDKRMGHAKVEQVGFFVVVRLGSWIEHAYRDYAESMTVGEKN